MPTTDKLADMLARGSAQMMANDPIARSALKIALLAADLFVPVEQDEAEQKQAGGVSLMAADIGGTPHVLLFSSKALLGAFTGPDTRFAKAAGKDIFANLAGHYAILNPGPNGRAFAPEDIADILGKDGAAAHVHGPDCGPKCGHDH